MPEQQTFTRAAGKVSSVDSEQRTVELCFASETPVPRYSYEHGRYLEVLRISKEAIDASRLQAGMSLLDSHRAHSVDSILGSVVPGSFRIESGMAFARIKFSRRQRAQELLQDLVDGHRLPISVGYKIQELEEKKRDDGSLVLTATRWTPTEISIVAVPADPVAGTRNEENMPTINTKKREAAEQDNTRENDIRTLARTAGIDETSDLVREALEENQSVEEFRSAMLDHLIAKENEAPTFPHSPMRGYDRVAEMRHAMASALIYRVDPSRQPSNDAREFVGLSIPEIARRGLEIHGVSTAGMSASQVIQRALHTTSDFSQVISHVGQTTLQTAYASVPSSLKTVARKTTIRGFRPKHSVRLSGFSDLEKVNEHGEFKRGTFTEGGESYHLETWGKVFGMTRAMMVNDDLGAFAEVSRELGATARRRESDVLANLVMQNPKMADGKPIFHVDHGNLATATGLDENSLSAARIAMAKQTGLSGELIDVTPKFLVVGLELQTTAEKLLTAIQATTTADVNVFANRLQLVVERRLTDPTAWYLVASPWEVPGLEYAYQEGEEGPQFFTDHGFNVDGVQIKVRLDFGAGFLDHRGWYKNPGS